MKRNLMVKTELPKLENFFERLQRSWKEAKRSMEMAKKAIIFSCTRFNSLEYKSSNSFTLPITL